ncbi:MAG TPA: CopD family protein [Gemmatimonadales bacterium]|nr:CopD family protein [Gemmatimonadales bacterium]
MSAILDRLLAPVIGGLILLTIALLIGVAVVMGLVRAGTPPPPSGATIIQGWMTRFPSLLAWFLLMLVLIRGMVQVLAFADPGVPADTELMRIVLTTGTWGKSWMVEVAAAFATLALMWLLAGKAAQRTALIVTTALIVLAEAGIGHGADAVFAPVVLGRVIHATHLLGGGLWFGTLAVMALAVLPNLQGADATPFLSEVLHGFSRYARVGVALVVVSGLVLVWNYSARLTELPANTWGQLLLIKLGLIVLMLGLGGYNWRVATPRVERGIAAGPSRLGRAVLIEAILGLLVIGVTAFLVRQALPIDLG